MSGTAQTHYIGDRCGHMSDRRIRDLERERDELRQFLRRLVPHEKALHKVVPYGGPRYVTISEYEEPWVSCSETEGGHVRGECPVDYDDDHEVAIRVGDIRRVLDSTDDERKIASAPNGREAQEQR